MDSFDALPLAAIVMNSFEKPQFFCVHGGLGPDITSVNFVFESSFKVIVD
jgi:diadenosine tetraphosphatase ApaH/serine/threonine PP2A family protein phosphatase